MDVEVDAMHASSWILILQHTLGTISEWNHAQALCSHRNGGCQFVHLAVADAFRCHGTFHPRIQDTGTVDAQQHAQSGLVGTVVHMRKGVHPAQLIIVHLTQHAIHHTAGSARGSQFSRLHHVQRKGIVWLVATSIRNRCTLSQA